MARCTVFDKQTAQAISKDLHLLVICDPEADPVQSALYSQAPTALAFLPAADGHRVLVAKFHRNAPFAIPSFSPSGEPVSFEASGFLGLSDQPVYAPQLERPKRWWQRILD